MFLLIWLSDSHDCTCITSLKIMTWGVTEPVQSRSKSTQHIWILGQNRSPVLRFLFKKELFLFRNVIPRPHFDTFCVCGADTAFRTNGWIYLWALVSTDQGGHAWSGTLLLVAWSVGASKGRMLRHMVVDFFFGPTIFAFLKQCEFPPVSNEPPGPTT